jgi:hypothetical protein
MSRFLAVEFTGSLTGVNKFFESKGWSFETKHVSDHKIYIRVPEDLEDEVTFFKGTPFEDGNGENTITSFKPIPESEFNKTAENGFEIINKQERLNSESSEPVAEKKEKTKEVVKEVKPANEQGFPSPLVDVAGKTEQRQASTQDNISAAFADAILPSKSPLPADDAFTFLISRNYLRNFVVASTVLLFVLTLLD